MVTSGDLRRIGPFTYEIPVTHRSDMRVPARLYADEEIVAAARNDRSLDQLTNTATLPGIVGYALAMPDIHQGYGFPIGGVVATSLPHGVVSPGGVGYDINCGVRLLGTSLDYEEIRPELDRLADALFRQVPTGVGSEGHVGLNRSELEQVLAEGSRWALREGFATADDVACTETGGRVAGANPEKVSPAAKKRGLGQLGTLGSGNHFVEIDVVREIRDARAGDAFGLRPGQVVIQIHCGSRGLGHQVATDYIQAFQTASRKFGFQLPDRQLVCAPLDSNEGQDYMAAMGAAANFAWANRQILTHTVREVFADAMRGTVSRCETFVVYDVAHNIAKLETHTLEGRSLRVCVHRKGATRSFGPGHPELPKQYADVGQPVLVPGSMGTASYVLAGSTESMDLTFGSCCHGAGRLMSRSQAKRAVRGEALRHQMALDGIVVRTHSLSGLAEEAPSAYKDVDRVVAIVASAGIATIVARLEPVAVIKG